MSPVATPEAPAPAPAPALAELRPRRAAAFCAFRALLLRDLAVLRKELPIFVVRTIMQPLLLLFVFTYVFPRIGQAIGGPGGGAAAFSTMLVSGVVATAMIFQGIQAVALPLVREFGYTREIEDRVLAPLAALTGACLGLALGTRVQPHQVPLMFSVIVIPITFLGATYYPWARLTPIPWLKVAVLVNPLVYMSEGFRMALTPVPHMPAVAVFAALIGFVAGLGWLGIDGFRRRVLA